MMRDPKYTSPEAWVPDLSWDLVIRLHKSNEQVRHAIETFDDREQSPEPKPGIAIPTLVPVLYESKFDIAIPNTTSPYESKTDQPATKTRFSRASPTNMTTLRNLPQDTNILLFTPVIIPAGHPLERDPVAVGRAFARQRKLAEEYKLKSMFGYEPMDSFDHEVEPSLGKPNFRSQIQTIDPFEVFGRALSSFHKHIRHVPYVAQKGFTDTHEGFISEADAVITVVCEPDYDKDNSVSNQMDFAVKVLDALDLKDSEVPNTLVLVQCGTSQYRLPIDDLFFNVIECQAYNEETAKSIAHTIFEGRIEDGRIEAFAY